MPKSEIDIIIHLVVENLKETRLAKGLSHQKLAEQSGVTRPAISFMESGKRKPSLDLVLKLCRGLNIKLEDVLAGARGNS